MNIRFYNAKILTLNEQEQFEIIRGELWVNGDSIRYVGESKKPAEICAELKLEMPVWERENRCKRQSADADLKTPMRIPI